MGIIGGKLLGPIIFDGQLTAERYLQFLRNQINDFIEDLPLANEVDIYIQQDGAPPHNSQVVVEHLNDTFSGKWIGTFGPIQWPVRSPDLTQQDFFSGEQLKIRFTIQHQLLVKNWSIK
ncbi:uncharacterized protein isoform X2 [Leptinotarsa decemlineata]|uniref:uncharacterized protein isoform X2 n=1 Tax=Leptinotarsa decemlineata TaxID=7539 RepID=UPI003D30AED3